MHSEILLHPQAVIHGCICVAIFFACICRLNSAVCKHFRTARARYALLLAGACASGLQPLLFASMPGVADTLLAAAVLAGMLINAPRWTHQPDPYNGETRYDDTND
ncbi:hypothetical protein CK623_11360 [Vandammella animalimorsus]|uniref:Uncharacterized protein n=1 Tax=Vandammella animalimorsus TaxID=2029117 RepID=A0A2A2AN31_9BURK|nr:hypothetical protein [Vandammella animalimorsus]PAT39153.1 hypothetical protein CK623_11360 [Vandammella animalimorsus]